MSTYEISVLCPRCDNEIEVVATVSGGYQLPTRETPGESPDVEFDAPTRCTHTPRPDEEFESGPFTQAELELFHTRIEEEALDAARDAEYDARWDGPEDDE